MPSDPWKATNRYSIIYSCWQLNIKVVLWICLSMHWLLMILGKTYLNKTKWKLNISYTICTFIPCVSPIINQFWKCTSIVISINTAIWFTCMKTRKELYSLINYSQCLTLIPDNTIDDHACEWKDHRIVQNRIICWWWRWCSFEKLCIEL